jgi:hypothetical protein
VPVRKGSQTRNAIALCAVAALGFWFFYSRNGSRPEPAEPSATYEETSGALTGRSTSPLSAIAICQKMAGAGIVANCQASTNPSGAPFDGVAFSIPQGSSGGMLVQAHDAATYGRLQQKITTGFILRFDTPRVIVQADAETPPEVRAKMKPFLDGLFGR